MGGITGCSTSENFLSYEFDVYGNTGRNTNYTSDRTEKPIDKAYKDGTTNHPATWYQGAEGVIPNDYYLHNHSYVRNKGTLKGVVDGESITEKSNMHANEYMMGIGSKTLDDYKVVIQGNQSNTHGGGVMNNGVVIAGTFDDMRTSIEAIKELQEVDGTVMGITKEQFTFNLKKNGKVLSTAKNDNTGKIAFSNIPIQEGVYTIEEDTSKLKGYESVVGEVKFNFETEVVETPSATELKQIDGIYRPANKTFRLIIPKENSSKYVVQDKLINKKEQVIEEEEKPDTKEEPDKKDNQSKQDTIVKPVKPNENSSKNKNYSDMMETGIATSVGIYFTLSIGGMAGLIFVRKRK